jgi:hypothetical protein
MNTVPTDILDLDVPDWAEHQAALLRRHAAGERVEGIDWTNIAGQIELIAKSEVAAFRSLLTAALQHLLKVQALPDHPARAHWLLEAETFFEQARDVFSPSMRRRVELARMYERARRLVLIDYPQADAKQMPEVCPFTLAEIVEATPDVPALLARLGRS